MRDRGPVQIQNPSELLISERTHGVPGSVVLCSMEGTRPVLVKQALVSTTAFGMAGACPPALITTGLFVDGCPGKGLECSCTTRMPI